MIRLLARLCVLSLAAAPALAFPAGSGPAVGSHAPDHGLKDYVGGDQATQEVSERSDGGRSTRSGSRGRADLPDRRGDVVMLYGSPLGDGPAIRETVLLLRDLLRSNEHRGIAAIAVTAGEPGEEISARCEALGIDWPVALVSGEATTPYWAPDENGPSCLFLVGRSGQLAWRGDPLARQADFLEAIDAALRQHAAPVLGRDLREELAGAQASYYAGEWDKARTLAEKAKKKLRGNEDAASIAVVEDASTLADLVLQHERDLLLAAREAMGKKRYVDFFETREAAEQGFKRTQLPKDIKEISKEAVKGMSGNMYKDAERWMEFQGDQPVLFPARKSKDGDRFAKELEKFVKSTVNAFAATQLANRMLEDYAGAR